jgi:hypothetical protein
MEYLTNEVQSAIFARRKELVRQSGICGKTIILAKIKSARGS